MKITMYELLGLIKDRKAPKKIIYDNYNWKYNNGCRDYIRVKDNTNRLFRDYLGDDLYNYLLTEFCKIIEEEKDIE